MEECKKEIIKLLESMDNELYIRYIYILLKEMMKQ
jgi:hypothetical protein